MLPGNRIKAEKALRGGDLITGKTRTPRTPSRESVFPGLERVRERARHEKKERFTALLHHVIVDLLRAAFSWLKRDAAPGVDGLMWQVSTSHYFVTQFQSSLCAEDFGRP